MKDYLELMKYSDLIKSIPIDKVKDYLSEGRFKIVKYKIGNIIHFEGETCSKLEVVFLGKVVIERIDESGNLLTIGEFSRGDIIGGNLLFSKNPYYPMTVTSKKPTVILEISKDLLLQLFSKNNVFLKKYLEYVSDNATILGDRIKYYTRRTIRESLTSYLEQERKNQNSNKIKLNITKKELAERIGVQRTSVSRELAKMRAEGLIKLEGKFIEILF